MYIALGDLVLYFAKPYLCTIRANNIGTHCNLSKIPRKHCVRAQSTRCTVIRCVCAALRHCWDRTEGFCVCVRVCVCLCVCLSVCVCHLYSLNGWFNFDEIFHKRFSISLVVPVCVSAY